MTQRFTHDCDTCRYVGQLGPEDVWIHEGGPLGGSIIRRYGPEGSQYLSLPLDMAEGAVKVAVHRLRHRYRECLREQIGQTVVTPEEVDEEIRHLFAVFSG